MDEPRKQTAPEDRAGESWRGFPAEPAGHISVEGEAMPYWTQDGRPVEGVGVPEPDDDEIDESDVEDAPKDDHDDEADDVPF